MFRTALEAALQWELKMIEEEKKYKQRNVGENPRAGCTTIRRGEVENASEYEEPLVYEKQLHFFKRQNNNFFLTCQQLCTAVMMGKIVKDNPK